MWRFNAGDRVPIEEETNSKSLVKISADDFEDLEEAQYEEVKDSTDYTVKEVREMASEMNEEELAAFTKNDDRKTVQKLNAS